MNEEIQKWQDSLSPKKKLILYKLIEIGSRIGIDKNDIIQTLMVKDQKRKKLNKILFMDKLARATVDPVVEDLVDMGWGGAAAGETAKFLRKQNGNYVT